MNKTILITAAILGILGISIGAFAAHGLKDLIVSADLATFETGVKYQMYHALFLLFVGSANSILNRKKIVVYILTILGVILFSGSIYGLSTNSLTTFNFKEIALLTPLGGLLLISAWVLLLIDFIKMPSSKLVK